MTACAWLLVVAVAAFGCSDADVSGSYTVALTNRDNGCMLANYTVGDTAQGIGVVITQNDTNVTLTVQGLSGVYLVALLGADKNVFQGGVDGDEVSVDSLGTRPQNMGNCTYTFNARIRGTIDGDALEGRIEYRAADNGNPDCAPISGCLTYQDFNGTRPPT